MLRMKNQMTNMKMMLYWRKLVKKVIRQKRQILARKVIQIKIMTRVTTKVTLAMIRTMMETVIRTIMMTMMSATMRVYKSVTSCVPPNLVEHAGHGKQDISFID